MRILLQLILIIEMPNKLKKVYELEGLVCDLHAHLTAESGSMMGISKSKATELISSTIFDYEPNSRYVTNHSVLMVANTKNSNLNPNLILWSHYTILSFGFFLILQDTENYKCTDGSYITEHCLVSKHVCSRLFLSTWDWLVITKKKCL